MFRRNLSERLNLSQEEGEKWIVNLIRETRMGADAKIDLEKVRLPFHPSPSLPNLSADYTLLFSLSYLQQNVIEINRPPLPVYQTVIEKTRQLAVRTQTLGVAVARSGQQQQSQQQSQPEAKAPEVVVA